MPEPDRTASAAKVDPRKEFVDHNEWTPNNLRREHPPAWWRWRMFRRHPIRYVRARIRRG